MAATRTSNCYDAVCLRHEPGDVVHPAYFPHRHLIAQAIVLKAGSAGNHAHPLAVEYSQTQQCWRPMTDQLDTVGVEADGLRLHGLALQRVQEPVKHLQPKWPVGGINLAKPFPRHE